MQFSPASNFISLWSKYSPQHLFSITLSLVSFLNVRDQVSHPYRTTGHIIMYNVCTYQYVKTQYILLKLLKGIYVYILVLVMQLCTSCANDTYVLLVYLWCSMGAPYICANSQSSI
jgi:hypothetical protein